LNLNSRAGKGTGYSGRYGAGSVDPQELLYTETHVWVFAEADLATVGVTEQGLAELGDVTRIEFAEAGTEVSQGGFLGEIEGTYTDHEYLAPIDGIVSEINQDILEDFSFLTDDPYGDGWLVKIRIQDTRQLADLLTLARYRKLIAGR